MSATPGVLFPNIRKIRGKALLSMKAIGSNFKGLLYWFAITIAIPVPVQDVLEVFFFSCFFMFTSFLSASQLQK